jgi:RNA-directed DNA polymerase
MGESGSTSKPYDISKWKVWKAYCKVEANRGAPGVDGQSLAAFETDLQGNLYKIWNRMSSGSYFPPPVRAVEIPKAGGGVRTLGVPTVADRVAQTVVAMELEEKVEPIFHKDSYGYRPNRSALDAVGECRRRCWSRDWVVDLDIARFFDTVDHDLMVKAVRAHRPGVGGAVCAAVAGCAAAASGRNLGGQGSWNPAGVSGLTGVGEPVSALRVRRLDGARVPNCDVRTVRR